MRDYKLKLRNLHTSHTQYGSVVYYESRKRDLKRRLVNEGRCDGRLKDEVEESYLTYTGRYDKTN